MEYVERNGGPGRPVAGDGLTWLGISQEEVAAWNPPGWLRTKDSIPAHQALAWSRPVMQSLLFPPDSRLHWQWYKQVLLSPLTTRCDYSKPLLSDFPVFSRPDAARAFADKGKGRVESIPFNK